MLMLPRVPSRLEPVRLQPAQLQPARPMPARSRLRLRLRLRRNLGQLAWLSLLAGFLACERQDGSAAPASAAPVAVSPASPPSAAAAMALPRSGTDTARAGDEPGAEPASDTPATSARAEGQLGPGRGTVLIDIQPPAGAKLNREAPLSARATGGIGLAFPERFRGPLGEHELPLRLPVDVEDGATGPAEVELSYYWCGEGEETTCTRETARLSLALDLTGDGAGGEAHLTHRAQPH